MTENSKKRFKPSVLSRDPYKRRTETEMIKIVTEVNKGMIGKRAAYSKYGLNRNTLALFIKKFSIRTLGTEISTQLLANMTNDQKLNLLEKKVKELTKALDYSNLKKDCLEIMIKVAEEDLHIKIRKRVVPNSQKNETKSFKGKPGKILCTVWCFTESVL